LWEYLPGEGKVITEMLWEKGRAPQSFIAKGRERGIG